MNRAERDFLNRVEKHKNYLLSEDKMMVAVKHEVGEDYINKLLRGERPTNTDKAKQILIDLEFLALQNMQLGIYKCEELGLPKGVCRTIINPKTRNTKS